MHLHRLKLTNFKNYDLQDLQLSKQLNCFVGKNGMGKTNLLDAIYYLCMCKSHFGLRDNIITRHGERFFRLDGIFQREAKKEHIVVKVIPRKKKEIERNKVIYKRLSEHIGLLPVVMIAPDDTILATGGSEERRRFLDTTIAQLDPMYLRYLIRYTKVLGQRNACLKKFAITKKFDSALLETYNLQLLQPARYLNEKRAEITKEFSPIFQNYYAIIANKQEEVNCVYNSKIEGDNLADLLDEAQEKDRILQRTTVGVHKDDLQFSINDYSLKRYASQGQLKSFVLALKLAKYELLRTHKSILPILLLDDIFDKLDAHRVEQLLGLLIGRDFGQIFITDTHENRVEEIVKRFESDYCKFVVKDGVVEKAII